MSGRFRRSETLWDKKEEKMPPTEIGGKIPWRGKDRHLSFRGGSSPKWSNSEANDGMMPGDFSGRPSWEPLQGNGNMPNDDDVNRDRRRMPTDPTFDEWEKQYNTRPSDDSYGLPHRGQDRGVGGCGSMSRDRDRSRSPKRRRSRSRSRGRGRDRGSARGVSRSRSRSSSRGRDWESTRARSRSPFYDDRRESNEYADIRNDSRLSSRLCKDFAAGDCRKGSRCRFLHQGILNSRGGGNQLHNNLTESWNRKPDYLGGSKHTGNRNSADHWRNVGSDGYKKDTGFDEEVRDIAKDAYLCNEFMEGRCHRGESCKFSHHVACGDDYRRYDKNAYDDQDRRCQSNRNSRVPCKFFSVGKCSRDDCKFSHDAPELGCYDGRSHDNVRGCNLGNKNRTWNDRQSRDHLNASDFFDFGKSNHNFDEKNKSWNGPSWDDVESGGFDERSCDNIQGHSLDDKNRTWDGPVPGDASGFSDVAKSKHNSDDKKKSWDGPSWDDVDASGFPNVGKSNPNLDNKNRPWDGPSWDEVSASGFSSVPKPCHNSDDSKKAGNGTSRGTMSASGFSYGAKSCNNIDGKTKSWNGPLWDEVSESGYSDVGKSSGGDGTSAEMLQIDRKIRKWDGPGWNEKTSEKNDYLLAQWTSVTKVTDIAGKEIGSIDDQELQLLPDGSRSHTLDDQAQHVMPQALGSRLANATTAVMPEVPGVSSHQKHERQGEDHVVINDSDENNANKVSKDANQQILTSGKNSIQSVHDTSSQSLSNLNGTEKSRHMLLSNPFNGPKIKLNGPVQDMFVHINSCKQTQIQNKEGGKPLEPLEIDVPVVMNDVNETSVTSEQVSHVNGFPASLPEISQKGQLPQVYTKLNLTNAINFLNSLPNSASSVPRIDPMVFEYNQDTRPKEQYDSARSMEVSKSVKTSVPMGILSGSVRQENQMPVERFPPISTGGSNSGKLGEIGVAEKEYGKSSKAKKQEPVGNPEGTESTVAENAKQGQENINPDNSEAQGKVEEGNISNDEKAMRQFKIALVEFVKEILKPTWKEGKMSREAHKTIVKKVVDKVTSTIQAIQIPRSQARIEQYLAFSKSKIAKLVEAYVERLLKA